MPIPILVATFASAAEPEKGDEPKKSEPSVKVAGVLYPSFGLDLTEGAELFNEFDMDRSYLRADAKLTDQVAVRLTLDANRLEEVTVVLGDGTEIEAANDPRLRVFVKHAWVEYKPIDDVQLRFGMVDTPFLPFQEQFEGMRYLFKVFLDEARLESTTDLGVSASGKHADGVVGWGVGVYNGEFYTNPEVDAGKSIQARVSFDPLATEKGMGLPLALYVDEELVTGDDPKTTFAGLVGFKAPVFLATAQVAGVVQGGTTGLGQSVVARADAPDVMFFLARLDRFDADLEADADSTVKVWGGVGRDFMKNVSAAVTYEREMPEGADPAEVEHGVFLHAQAGF